MNTPYHTHDCDRCVFLGRFAIVCGTKEAKVDAYVCNGHNTETLIARIGSEGPEYHALDTEIVASMMDRNDLWTGVFNLYQKWIKKQDRKTLADAAGMIRELANSTGVVCNLYGGLKEMEKRLRDLRRRL